MEFFDTVVTDEAKSNVLRCLDSGRLSEGKLVLEFEERLQALFGYADGVAVNSCTSALHLALILSGVTQGDEVILPAQTFIATGLAITYCGAKPVFVDIDRDTGNIDPERIPEKITAKTKAVISVAWGGNPPNLEELQRVCERHGLRLIQDNAQALGARYLGSALINYGDFSCFSFQAIKHLTTGDGGLLVCRQDRDTVRARKLRWFGIDRDNDKADLTGERLYDLKEIGYKYHMNDLAAAVGLGNMGGILERLRYVEEIASYYDENIPYGVQRDGSSNWLYTLLVDRRDDFIRAMRGRNIPVSVVHVGIDRSTVFSSDAYLPNQRYWDRCHVCIPCHSGLRPKDSWEVVLAIKKGW